MKSVYTFPKGLYTRADFKTLEVNGEEVTDFEVIETETAFIVSF